MKYVKRISFFLIMSGMMFSAGGYLTLKAEQFFYPQKYERQYEQILPKATVENSSKASESVFADEKRDDNKDETQVIETVVENAPIITANTVYMIEEVNLSDGSILEKEADVPVKYIGLNREMLIEELAAYELNPPLSDLRLGFESIELSAFSKDRVVVCKYYRPKKEEQGYYLMVAEHYVIVYEKDKKTVHMNTEILLESLDYSLQKEILEGKYMEDEQALYNFLESYSS